MAKDFWNGFGAGAAAAGAGLLLARTLRRAAGDRRVLRLEKTLQIGRPVEEVFAAWAQIEQLPRCIGSLVSVSVDGNCSHWVMRVNGRQVEWDAELVQSVQNQALGWKSANGPKHTGRINFAPLGRDTVVHVTMNYAPPLGVFSHALAEFRQELERHLDQALRDFKAWLEGKGQEQSQQATGTYGPPRITTGPGPGPGPIPSSATLPAQAAPSGPAGTPGESGGPGTVPFTRPPEEPYP